MVWEVDNFFIKYVAQFALKRQFLVLFCFENNINLKNEELNK